ncbi:MAG: hypothetical protein HY307_04715, partial [Arcobacter sp.]|nr:hypothetical protein [Arcobacter sp.]
IVENDNILRVVRIADASKYNIPVVNSTIDSYQMITEVFAVENMNVDVVSSRIRHLISTNAKLVTDKDSNAIVITDFVPNIKTIKAVISLLAVDMKKHIEVVKLLNLKAVEMQVELTNVAKTIYGEQIEGEKVAIILNKDTNSLMLVGKKSNVEYLIKYVKNIDKEGSLVAKSVEVVALKNAEAKGVIAMINGVITNKQYKDPNDKPYASSDEESNSIILMGQKEELEYYKELVKKLDIDKQQVYVQARIIEVSENKTRDVGIKYGLSGNQTYGSGLASFSAHLSENSIIPSIPLVSTSTGNAGEIISANKNVLAMGVSLNLLNQNGAAEIISEPSLLCINNKKSTIYVGQTVSVKTGSTTSTGGVSNDTYKREDIGLTLSVKPRISTGGKVLLDLITKVEDVSKSGGINGQPDTSKKELETSAIVNDGESVILGGYIKTTHSNTEDKVPFFGDIPLIGYLFRNNRNIDDKINLVIIITPYIVPQSKDLTYVRNQLNELKILEDKYTKDAMLRLEEMKIKAEKENINRDTKLLKLENIKKDVASDRADIEEDKQDFMNKKNEISEEKAKDEEKKAREELEANRRK